MSRFTKRASLAALVALAALALAVAAPARASAPVGFHSTRPTSPVSRPDLRS